MLHTYGITQIEILNCVYTEHVHVFFLVIIL